MDSEKMLIKVPNVIVGLMTTAAQQERVETKIDAVTEAVDKLTAKVETLDFKMEKAIDIDAITVIDHERRISVLELANG